MSFAIFDENYYLANNPDVKAAVDAGNFSSGLQHFQQTGLAEGRVLVSPYYDEQFYLRANPDVAAAVAAGGLRSGLQHYIQNGETEGRSAGAFNEQIYLAIYPDVAAAVTNRGFSSGLQHYIQFGQFEANRVGWFLGTSGNDIITSFGQGFSAITGISYDNLVNNLLTGGAVSGVGSVDTLIGKEGADVFALGYPSVSLLNSAPQQFYVGRGNSDYALIQNFESGRDVIGLQGAIENYNLQAVNGNLNISTASGDLIGIVEGVTSLSPVPIPVGFSGLPSNTFGSFFGLT